jgi:hypothetical protein
VPGVQPFLQLGEVTADHRRDEVLVEFAGSEPLRRE